MNITSACVTMLEFILIWKNKERKHNLCYYYTTCINLKRQKHWSTWSKISLCAQKGSKSSFLKLYLYIFVSQIVSWYLKQYLYISNYIFVSRRVLSNDFFYNKLLNAYKYNHFNHTLNLLSLFFKKYAYVFSQNW